MKRSASAVWKGSLNNGTGSLTTESGALADADYSFASRFEDQRATNPEELIAAAHAGCFSMALSGELGKLQLTPTKIETRATVELSQTGADWAITSVLLDVSGEVPDGSEADFEGACEKAKANCPVSKLLNAEIKMQFHWSPDQTLQESA